MTTLCYSVRLESLVIISDKCYKARGFDGSEDLIPSRFVYGQDYEVQKCNAYWIAAWILEKKHLQYSTKKAARFTDEGVRLPNITIEHHTPDVVVAVESNEIQELKA